MDTFESERWVVRRLEDRDADDLFALRSSPEVNQFIERNTYEERKEVEDFLATEKEKRVSGEWFILGIEHKASARLIGSICLFSFLPDLTTCEMGYELHPDFQGQGIMQEVLSSFIQKIKMESEIKNLIAVIHQLNVASQNLIVKLNFTKGSRMEDVKDGYDCYYRTLHE